MSKAEFDRLRVDIWISGTATENGDGGFACLLQQGIESKVYSKHIAGYAKGTTVTRMSLKALHEALCLLKNPCFLHIYTTCAQVSQGVNKYMYNWSKNNWKTSKGETVKHADLWQGIHELLEEKSMGHKVHYQKQSPNGDNNMKVIHRSSSYVAYAEHDIYEVKA